MTWVTSMRKQICKQLRPLSRPQNQQKSWFMMCGTYWYMMFGNNLLIQTAVNIKSSEDCLLWPWLLTIKRGVFHVIHTWSLRTIYWVKRELSLGNKFLQPRPVTLTNITFSKWMDGFVKWWVINTRSLKTIYWFRWILLSANSFINKTCPVTSTIDILTPNFTGVKAEWWWMVHVLSF